MANSQSMVLASWAGYENARQPAGCDERDVICLDAEAEVHLTSVETITGPTLPTDLTATTIFHADPRPGTRLLMAVNGAGATIPRASILAYVSPRKRQACVPIDYVKRLKLTVPVTAYRSGDRYCFSEY